MLIQQFNLPLVKNNIRTKEQIEVLMSKYGSALCSIGREFGIYPAIT